MFPAYLGGSSRRTLEHATVGTLGPTRIRHRNGHLLRTAWLTRRRIHERIADAGATLFRRRWVKVCVQGVSVFRGRPAVELKELCKSVTPKPNFKPRFDN
jgi:hypothetical protein